MNIELFLALGTTIAAVTVPYFTNKNNNEHQRMMKKMDLIFAEKYKAYSNFCYTYSVAISSPTPENIAAFKAAINQTYLLNANIKIRHTGLSCAKHIENSDPKAEEEFMECSTQLSLELDDMIFDFENPII